MTAVSMAGAKTRTDSGRGRPRSFFRLGFVSCACLALLAAVLVAVPIMQAHAAPGTQSIAMGSGGHKLQIRSDGTLWAWAYNSRGQLGLGDTTDRLVPVQVGTDTDWVSVAAGGYAGVGHSLALKDDGTLWAWGYNYYGQLGLGDTTNRTAPTQVGTDTDWVSVTAGQQHSLAIKADGTLWVWGYNYFGQLGLGDTTNRTAPTQVGTDTDWVQAAGNSFSSYVTKTGGALWSWGYNASGQLGLGDTTNRTAPTQVGTDTDWAMIGCGESFAVGIRSDGTLWTWGDNASGQLGHGDTTGRNVPTQVGTDTTWAQAEGGSRHVIAVRTDGTLWAWGLNYAGNLGLGDLVDRWVPTQVGTGSGWAFPVAGVNDSGALKADGSAWLWGYNLENRLGFGSTAPARFVSPALLAAPPVLAAIGDKTVDELAELTFTATATDADLPADTLTYALDAGAPAGAMIDGATGVFSWTPTEAQGPGSYNITVTVSDGKGGTDSETITVTVAEVNTAPLLAAIGDKTVDELVELTFTASATDADLPANTLSYSLGAGAPAGAMIDGVTGVFSWTPTEAQAPGSYNITVTVSDGKGGTDSETITVTVAVVEVILVPVFGADRIETAVEASGLGFPGGSEYVVVATALSFPDSLCGSALAGALDAPILLTYPTALPDAVKAEVARLGATRVIVLGGTGAVSTGVHDALVTLPGVTVERIWGATRYATAEAVAERTITEMGTAWDGTAFVATGAGFADALGAAPLAAANGWPIYLLPPDVATHATSVTAMKDDGVTSALVLGGTAAVPDSFETLLNTAFTDEQVTRLWGANRYATALAVARYGVTSAGLSWDHLAIATGKNFPDALSGGALQGASRSVMLLTDPAGLDSDVLAELVAQRAVISEVRFLGGAAAVPQTIRDAVALALE